MKRDRDRAEVKDSTINQRLQDFEEKQREIEDLKQQFEMVKALGLIV